MSKQTIPLAVALLTLFLSSLACGSSGRTPTPPPPQAATASDAIATSVPSATSVSQKSQPITTVAPAAQTSGPTVKTAANLRAGPGTSYAKNGSAAVGQALDIIGRNAAGDWYQLRNGAWIAAFLVNNAPTVPVAASIPTPAAPVRAATTDQIFKGKGQQASPKFELPAGLVTFQMTHDGQRNFIVSLLDDQGELVDGLVNEIGPYKGSKAIGVSAGAYLMDIDADSNWTIAVQQPVPAGEGVAMPIQGKGDQAIVFLKLDKGLATFRLTHDGQRNFIVHLLDDQGQLVDGLVNEIGPFDGSKAMRIPSSGYYVINVMADGTWNISEK